MIENFAAFYLLGTQPATVYPYAPGSVNFQGAQAYTAFAFLGAPAANVQAGPGGAVPPPVVPVTPTVPGTPTPPAGSIEPYWGGVGGGPAGAGAKPPAQQPRPKRKVSPPPPRKARQVAQAEPVGDVLGRMAADVMAQAHRRMSRAASIAEAQRPAYDAPQVDDERDIEMLLLGI